MGTDAATALQCATVPNTPTKLQIEIVRALGRIGTATSLEYLRSCLSRESVRAGNSDGSWGRTAEFKG